MMSPMFPVTHSILSPDALVREVLSQYEIGAIRDCRFYTHNLSDTYFVWAERSRFALRVYRTGWRTDAQIRGELEAIERIATCEAPRGVAFSRPMVGRDGEMIRAIRAPEGRRQVVLFTLAPGREEVRDEAEARLYGRGAAHMHAATDGWRASHEAARPPIDLDELLERPLQVLAPLLAEHTKARDYLLPLAERLRARFEALPPEKLELGWCYGDFHGGNAAFEKDEGGHRVTFFDFDLCGIGWRAYDVAVFRWGLTGGWVPEKKAVARWAAFLEGYAEVRRLQEIDLSAMPLFVMLRQYWFLALVVAQAVHRGHWWPLREGFFPSSIKMLKQWEKQLDAGGGVRLS